MTLDTVATHYGPVAFGVVALVTIWRVIVAPVLRQIVTTSADLGKTVQQAAHATQSAERAAEAAERVAERCEAVARIALEARR